MSLGGHVFTTSPGLTQSYLLFGYDTGRKQWVWLGIDENLRYSDDTAESSSDEKYSVQNGNSFWDAQWLFQTYSLEMKALPDDWQGANDQAQLQAILDLINSSEGR